MNNEEKILSLLEKMEEKLNNLEQGQSITNQRLDKLETSVDLTNQRLDKLETSQSELRLEMNERFDSLEYSLEQAWQDIGLNGDDMKRHEREFHSMGIR